MAQEKLSVEQFIPSLHKLTEDEQMLREAAAEFAQTIVAPYVHEMDQKAKLNPDLVKSFFEQGLMGIEVPAEYNGAGGTFFMSILAIEEVSKVDASAAVFMDVQNTLVNNAILHWADDNLKRRYFPLLATEKVGAYALSEAASGSDAFALKCRAKKQETNTS